MKTSKYVGTNQFSGKSLADRFWEKVDVRDRDSCWKWQGSRHWQWKYGSFMLNGKVTAAHRIAWVLYYGYIPQEMLVCHKCDNPPRVNPNHLFLGTVADNNLDKKLKGRQDERGEKNGRARLVAADVLEIRRLFSLGVTGAEIGRAFNITKEHAYGIRDKKAWSHLEESK